MENVQLRKNILMSSPDEEFRVTTGLSAHQMEWREESLTGLRFMFWPFKISHLHQNYEFLLRLHSPYRTSLQLVQLLLLAVHSNTLLKRLFLL